MELDESTLSTLQKKRLLMEVKQMKEKLSINSLVKSVLVDFFDGKNMEISLTQAEMLDFCSNQFSDLEKLLMEFKAQGGESDWQNVQIIGGTTRVPKAKELILKTFGDYK